MKNKTLILIILALIIYLSVEIFLPMVLLRIYGDRTMWEVPQWVIWYLWR